MKDGYWTPWHLAQERIAELEKESLKAHGWIAKAMMQGLDKVDCSDELLKIIAKRDLEQQAKGIESLKFPTMLRKMWSGGDVQKWILEQAKGGAE
jgi:hypothetical protein